VAHPQIAVFARLADKNTQPVRKIEGQKTLLGRTMHGFTYDEIHDEFTVPQQFAQAILTFAGGAEGETPPVRVIQGSRTRLEAPDRVAVDAVNNEIFVPEGDKVLVFDRAGNGNVAPKRALEGPDVGRGLDALAIDPVNNLLIVSAGGGGGDREGRGTRFLVFDRLAAGNVKPKIIIQGPRAMGGPFAVYPARKLIFATNRPVDEALAGDDSYLGVWSYEKSSNGPALWTIGGPKGIFQMPRGVALDVKNKSIIASDKRLNSVLTFRVPEVF
jgi:DNA-binding beta-propeller fold protein YncE